MRQVRLLALVLMTASFAAPAFAAEARCPSPIGECLYAYQAVRERPWIGVEVETDSVLKRPVIVRVTPGSPAERAKLQPGDVLRSIDGQVPSDWFAGKAGWKSGGEPLALEVVRKGAEVAAAVPRERIAEDHLARLIGVHMLEGHLAHMSSGEASGGHEPR